MSLKSMTGFAQVRKQTPLGEATVTVKSVNHRALDLHTHLPAELEPYEAEMRQSVKRAVARGHVDLRVSFVPHQEREGPSLNRTLFENYLRALQEMREHFGVKAEPDANAALRVPGMLTGSDFEEPKEELGKVLVEALDEALVVMDRFRVREGAEMGLLMKGYNASIRRDAQEIETLRSQVGEFLRQRLETRLAELLQGAQVDPARLAQEVAILADRSDISEELGRLRVHAGEVDQLLDKGGETGKKLDFLLQEMNRETNTVLSKTSGAGECGMRITALGLEIKANIERIREQTLNLE